MIVTNLFVLSQVPVFVEPVEPERAYNSGSLIDSILLFVDVDGVAVGRVFLLAIGAPRFVWALLIVWCGRDHLCPSTLVACSPMNGLVVRTAAPTTAGRVLAASVTVAPYKAFGAPRNAQSPLS